MDMCADISICHILHRVTQDIPRKGLDYIFYELSTKRLKPTPLLVHTGPLIGDTLRPEPVYIYLGFHVGQHSVTRQGDE